MTKSISDRMGQRISGEAAKKVVQVAEEVIFVPTRHQKKARALYYTKADGLSGPPTLELALRLGGNACLTNWWGIPGFKEWFQKEDNHRATLDYLFNLSMERAEDILVAGPDEYPAAVQAQMIKMVWLIKAQTDEREAAEKGLLTGSKEDIIKTILTYAPTLGLEVKRTDQKVLEAEVTGDTEVTSEKETP